MRGGGRGVVSLTPGWAAGSGWMELQAPQGQASCSMYEPWEGQP